MLGARWERAETSMGAKARGGALRLAASPASPAAERRPPPRSARILAATARDVEVPQVAEAAEAPASPGRSERLRARDSNPNYLVQSEACCRYTSPQSIDVPNYRTSFALFRSSRSIGTPAGGSVRDACEHMFVTRERVHTLLRQGLSRKEIADLLGISKATVSYHARRLGAPVDPRFARRYDWA